MARFEVKDGHFLVDKLRRITYEVHGESEYADNEGKDAQRLCDDINAMLREIEMLTNAHIREFEAKLRNGSTVRGE